MNVIKKFIPENYKNLSNEERELAITEFINDLCKKLKIEPLEVIFRNLTDEKGVEYGGKFIHNPTCIAINEKFIETDKKISFIIDQGIDYDIGISYFLVHAMAHECYHYYQFCLEKKLIDEQPLTEEEKISAYIYFIGLHTGLFATYNEKKLGYVPETKISKENVYLYAPIEIGANSFASEIVEVLGNNDLPENHEAYKDIIIQTNFKLALRNHNNGGNLTELSILYSLETVKTFLEYKNATSGVKEPYLGIKINELEKYIDKALEKWKEIDKRHKKLVELYQKINPKNKK